MTNAEGKQQPLRVNLTLVQIKLHEKKIFKRYKILNALHSSMIDTIFTIMNCETTKETWYMLQEEFQRSSRMRKIQILNLRSEF